MIRRKDRLAMHAHFTRTTASRYTVIITPPLIGESRLLISGNSNVHKDDLLMRETR